MFISLELKCIINKILVKMFCFIKIIVVYRYCFGMWCFIFVSFLVYFYVLLIIVMYVVKKNFKEGVGEGEYEDICDDSIFKEIKVRFVVDM